MPSSGSGDWARRVRDSLRKHEEERATKGVILGRYVLGEELGRGGMATVHRARDRTLDRDVAVKVLHESASGDESARRRFEREARTMGGLSHPNLLQIYDLAEEGGRIYLIMELVEGRSLRQIVEAGNHALPALLRLLEKAARGIGRAHADRIVHRDLKPGNILVSREGEPKVADFGLAQLSGRSSIVTQTGVAVGTPRYMAREQVLAERGNITPATDVYALGVILYEILTNRPVHGTDSVGELCDLILHEEPVSPRALDPTIAPEIEAVCLKAIDKTPGLRYVDGTEFADDLKRYLDGEPVLARRPGPFRRIRKRVGRRPAAWALGAAAALAALAATLTVAFLLFGESKLSRANELALRAERRYDAGDHAETRRLAGEALELVPGHEGARHWLTRLKIREYQSLRGLPEARVVRGLVE
ncbi:MAG: serine/threonine-protein kinase, partial [Planctomycetota bacterium]